MVVKRRISVCIVFWLMLLVSVSGQKTYPSYWDYISRYSSLAVKEMHRYGIPASITLAQGLLESGAGKSRLAVVANNHFGIKAHRDWSGPYVLEDDDASGERFRKYNSVEESYEDHSKFLLSNSRYASLFRLKSDDYRGWATGLKAAGYATNPRYAQILINIIETYNLHEYDGKHHRHEVQEAKPADASTATPKKQSGERMVMMCNGKLYTVARQGDTFKTIGKWAGKSARSIRRYNELPKGATLSEGDIVFLEKKASKAHRSLRGTTYTVKAGDSMHSISQHFGIRMKTLYKKNHLDPDSSLRVGQVLKVR